MIEKQTRESVYLGTLVSTVKQPYRNTATPKAEAGISSCVYTPNQAKYRPIFSPKYFLLNTDKQDTEPLWIWLGKQPLNTSTCENADFENNDCTEHEPTIETECHSQVLHILQLLYIHLLKYFGYIDYAFSSYSPFQSFSPKSAQNLSVCRLQVSQKISIHLLNSLSIVLSKT